MSVVVDYELHDFCPLACQWFEPCKDEDILLNLRGDRLNLGGKMTCVNYKLCEAIQRFERKAERRNRNG